ncbi:chymotrypsin-like serine proteinase [Haliotis cracherodii]|uniref:chymotrypsin-like serine proteinase n=1 Tax=Haliotis cracherodii TaxID=6455 RepID=UPI0039EC4056
MNALLTILLCTLAATAMAEISPRIAGGSNASPGEFPWQGSVQVRRDGSWFHSCGCVLYTATKVLTAAHCLYNSASDYRVIFGMHRVNIIDGTEQYSSVTSYTNHPQYDGNAAGFPNDIAVIRLETPMDTSSPAVSTITLASGSNDFAGSRCTISGWGVLPDGSTPDILQKVTMTTITNSDCASRWSGASGAAINSGHICIFESGKASCSRDSGGPMVCNGQLAGITSWGVAGCVGTHPSVYARVSHYHNWIQSQ